MELLCHRCGASLNPSDLFCPSCAAPQLRFEPRDGEEQPAASAQPTRFSIPHEGISWKDAIRAAILLAVPVGIFSSVSFLAHGCCLWVAGGAVLAVGLYHRRAPGYSLDTRAGVRIGALTGLLAAYVFVAVSAIARVVERFAFHLGGRIDSEYESLIRQSMTMVRTTPDTQAQMHAYLNFLMTPDGRAAYALMNSAAASIGMILFSAVGGALGVRLFSRRSLPGG